MPDIKELEERVKKLEEKAQKAVTDTVLVFTLGQLKDDMKRLESRLDQVLDKTIDAITKNNVEGLKQIKNKR